jgi:hypothetical protein
MNHGGRKLAVALIVQDKFISFQCNFLAIEKSNELSKEGEYLNQPHLTRGRPGARRNDILALL